MLRKIPDLYQHAETLINVFVPSADVMGFTAQLGNSTFTR